MAQGKQPVIYIDDLPPNNNPAGYQATWQEGSLIAYARLLPLDGDPGRGYLLDCNYHTVTGREPTARQIDPGTTLTSKVRDLMIGQMTQAGWQVVGAQHDQQKNIWQHSSHLVSSTATEQIAPPQCGSCGATQGNILVDRDEKTNEIHGYLCAKCSKIARAFHGNAAKMQGILTYIDATRGSNEYDQVDQAAQDKSVMEEQVSVTLDDYTVSPYMNGGLRRNYQSVAVQEDVQAIVMFWPWPHEGEQYLLQVGVDRNPFTGEQMTPEQEKRAQALLPALIDQVHAALVATGWSVVSHRENDERQREIWHVADHFSAPATRVPARPRVQSQAVPVPAAQADVTNESNQATLPGQRVLAVPAHGRISGYKRTITAHAVTYTCSECGQETTKDLYPGAAPRYCDSCANTIRRAKTLARVRRLRTQKREGISHDEI